MKKFWTKPLLCLTALSVAMLFSTGCASGGFKLTREYAQFVNSKSLILRIILYIFTSVVFAITLIIDFVVFNTIDFWDGKVSQGDYQFKGENKTYLVKHEYLPGSLLKRSTIQILNDKNVLIQKVVLSELPSGEIDMTVDGKLRAHVKNISSLPIVSVYDKAGRFVEDQVLRFKDTNAVAVESH